MAQKSKVHRGVRRHPHPCYCLYCESNMLDDYLDKKAGHIKHPKREIDSLIQDSDLSLNNKILVQR